MEIKINGHPADITIDKEKTIGDVMAGVENWLANSGHRLSGLSIDGEAANSTSLEDAFKKEINTIKVLDIYTSSVADLSIMSLVNLINDIDDYEALSFDEREGYLESWQQSPQAQFAFEQMRDLFEAYAGVFSNSGLTPQTLRAITEERMREVETPAEEFKNIKNLVEETCARLVDLPLDIQTGKDERAAQTIQLFSGIAEKIFRLYKQLNIQGYFESVPDISSLLNDFNSSSRELLNAYEANDSVLIGDLAEYEISPKLQQLYNTIAGIKW
jgi:hypothetical protein